MLDRIEETVLREDQFAADAAHELRTPLAILRTRIETTLLRERTKEEYVSSHQSLLSELDRLTHIVEALLRTARRSPTLAQDIDLEPILLESAARWQDQFVEAEVFLNTETVPAMAVIEKEEFTVVVDNLLDNALRFSPKGSTVSIRLEQTHEHVELSIHDQGPGISTELAPRVFDRFVRSSDDRNRLSGGAGIGLAVCKKILNSRGATISVKQGSEAGANIVCVFKRPE